MRRQTTIISAGHAPMPCYLSLPDEQPAPGVILLQEIFGINEDVKNLTDLIAAGGYGSLN